MLRGWLVLLCPSWAVQQFRSDVALRDGQAAWTDTENREPRDEEDLNGARPGSYGAHDRVDEPEELGMPRTHRDVHPHGYNSFAERTTEGAYRTYRKRMAAVEEKARVKAKDHKEREAIRAYAKIMQHARDEAKRSGVQSKFGLPGGDFMSTILDVMMDVAGALVSTKPVVPGDYPYMCVCAPPEIDYETGEMKSPLENNPLCPSDHWAMDCYVTRMDRERIAEYEAEHGALTNEEAAIFDMRATGNAMDDAMGTGDADAFDASTWIQTGENLTTETSEPVKPRTLMQKALSYVETELGTNAIPQLNLIPGGKNLKKTEMDEILKANQERERVEIRRLEELMATPLSTKFTRVVVTTLSFLFKLAAFGMMLLAITLVLKKENKMTRTQRKERQEPGSTK